MADLKQPFTREKMTKLNVGEAASISGTIYTCRDAASRILAESKSPPIQLKDAILYHCGPIIKREGNGWKVIAAGPTTSMRMETCTPKLIEMGVTGIIGKGGMGAATAEACKKFGCCYFLAIGGAAQLLAKRIKSVKKVYMLDELGPTEAIWELEVDNFPAFVTIDSHGHNLHDDIMKQSSAALRDNFKSKIKYQI